MLFDKHNKVTIADRLFCVLFSAIFILPFVVFDRIYNSYKISEEFGFYFIFSLLFLLLGLILIIKKKDTIRFYINRIDLLVIVIYFYLLLRNCFSNDFGLFNNANFKITIYFIIYFIAKYFISYYSSKGIFSTYFTNLILFIACVEITIGILQNYYVIPLNHPKLISGSFYSPALYSAFLALVFPFALTMCLKFKISLKKDYNKVQSILFQIFCYFSLIGTVAILPLTKARASWLAVILSGIYIIASQYRSSKINLLLKRNKYRFISLFAFVLIVGLFILYKPDSALGRILIWKVSGGLIIEKPILGHGLQGFNINYLDFQSKYFQQNGSESEMLVADSVQYAYNEFLRVFVEYGIIGILFILFLLYEVFRPVNKKNDKSLLESFTSNHIISRAIILSFCIICFFSFPFVCNSVSLLALFSLAAISENYICKRNTYRIRSNYKYLLSGLLIFVSMVTFIFQLNRFLAYNKWYYNDYYQYYAQIYSDLRYEPDFLLKYAKELSLAGKPAESNKIYFEAKKITNDYYLQIGVADNYEKLEELKEAERHYLQAYYMVPAKFYPQYRLSKLYLCEGDTLKAKEMASKLLKKKIKIKSSAIDQIKNEMQILINE
jgi:O-antigen polymerase